MSTCTGTLSSLRGELVLFTGKSSLNGEHVTRDVLRAMTIAAGGKVATDQSRKVTVLVLGETWSGPLHDERRRYSKKATFVEAVERETGKHVHMIDGTGFTEVLQGGEARRYQLRPPTSPHR